MLDTMREGSKGVAAKIILIVVILSFALAGVSSYLGGSNSVVAVEVNGVEISQASVDQAYKTERTRLQEQYGEQFDMIASSPNFAEQVQAQVTQNLISENLIAQAISEMGLRIGDDQVKNEIRAMKEFQVDGKFNNEQYLALLRRASYTPAMFSQSIKEDAARRQLLQMLVGSEFVTPLEVADADKLQAQKRVAQLLTVKVTDFSNNKAIPTADIEAYYHKNAAYFKTAEQVSVDYVLLDSEQLAKDIKITDKDIEEFYDHNSSDFKRAERRQVAHILIQGNSSEAKEKAQAILTEVQNGADFATLAKEKSDDTFSAKKNGMLDWMEKGVMDPAFDKAAFALTKANPISELVKSKFGYHIIKLVAVKKATTRPLSEVRDQVVASLKKAKISEHYYDLQQRLGEVAFESPDSLDEAAGAINMQVQHASFFTAQNAPTALANKAVLRTVFDVDFREQGMNSEIIEISDTASIVVRVNDHKA
ncbi:MAG TPA: peptidylprolyl isomerase, partial [Psychromonas hadalis]|nr:peptidylprolyl isomerase [Psychromonas hadalis]